nr:reverse transcriptase domain-containing protein [Tanacetum cinerariifolium]
MPDNFLDKMPQDCLRIIESKSKVCNSRNTLVVSRVSTNTSSTNITQFPEVVALIDAVKDLIRQNKTPTPAFVKSVEEICVTCGGPHPYYNCTATDGNVFKDNIQEYVSAATNMMASYFQTNIASDSSSGSGSLPSNTVANPRDELKAITTRSGISYDGPTIPPTTSLPPKEVVREPKVTKDKVQPTRSESTTHVQPPVVQVPIQEPDVAPKTIPKSSIPYPSRLNDQKLHSQIARRGGNPTPSDPIIATYSPSFTHFEGSDFILEELETLLSTLDELSNCDDDYYDTKRDILYLEQLLNEDPSPNPFSMKNEDLNPWVKPVHCVPKKGGMTVVENEDNQLIPTRLVTGWCMMAIFHNMIEETMEVFMDDFSVFGDSFSLCLSHLDKMLKRCEDTNLVLNWEKCHFMAKEGIVLGHKISKSRIEVDKAKVDVIAKLPHPTSVKGAENLAADHLSRLKNPNQGDLENKEITKTFPLEALGVISSHNVSSTLWIALNFKDYRACGFCPSSTRSLILSTLIYGNPIS